MGVRPDLRSSTGVLGAALLIASLACVERDESVEQGASEPAIVSTPQTDEHKALYSLGAMFGLSISKLGLTESEFEWVAQGASDVALGRQPAVKTSQYADQLKDLFASRAQAGEDSEAAASAAFLEEAAAAEGAVQTPSGLVMTELVAGEGEAPSPTDTVVVHYHGTFRDGSVFDSSIDRGSPARFPLNRVIPCWTEAVTQMKVGGKSRIVCPASIAYGTRGTGKIPGGATLTFEVELLEIVEQSAPAG